MYSSHHITVIKNLLFSIYGNHEEINFRECFNGGNNKAYLVEIKDTKIFAKIYFSDLKCRLEKEWKFSQYAKSCGIKCIPYPIAYDYKSNVALYEFIEGRKPLAQEISIDFINQAIDFLKKLNQNINCLRDYNCLPIATEACFTLEDHFAVIESRLLKLSSVNSIGKQNLLLKEFNKLVSKLSLKWKKLKNIIVNQAMQNNLDLNFFLEQKFWCISPSDFGFHNSILKNNQNNLYFFDFEYAGWDDPAKMIIDFLLQPGIPVPTKYHDSLISKVLHFLPNSEKVILRIKLLYPILTLKWSCIILNCFLPEWIQREIVITTESLLELQESRLNLAHNYLEKAILFND